MQIFLKLGLVEVLDSGTFYMSNIELLIGQSSTEAERKRAARLQNKALSAPRTNGGHLSDIRPQMCIRDRDAYSWLENYALEHGRSPEDILLEREEMTTRLRLIAALPVALAHATPTQARRVHACYCLLYTSANHLCDKLQHGYGRAE